MFRVVRNIVIVVALIAAVTAAYVTLFPSYPYSIVVVNRAGGPISDVKVTVQEMSGQEVGSAAAASLAEGQSLSLGHSLKTLQLTVVFSLRGQSYEPKLPYVSFATGKTATYAVQSDGTLKIAPTAGP